MDQPEKEVLKWREKIKDDESRETVDISGFGGGYEATCQRMLWAGIKYLSDKPNFVFDYQEFKNVYGICYSDSEHAKRLDAVLLEAAEHDCTGAMHQAVIGHLRYIHEHSYTEWLSRYEQSRRYVYPAELPT